MVELVSAVAAPPAASDEGDAKGKIKVADIELRPTCDHRVKTKPMGYQ